MKCIFWIPLVMYLILLFEANVEALVQVEAGVFECVKVITSDPDEMCFYCGTCGELPGRGKKEHMSNVMIR